MAQLEVPQGLDSEKQTIFSDAEEGHALIDQTVDVEGMDVLRGTVPVGKIEVPFAKRPHISGRGSALATTNSTMGGGMYRKPSGMVSTIEHVFDRIGAESSRPAPRLVPRLDGLTSGDGRGD